MMNASIALLFATATQTFNLPVGLMPAVCFVETHHDVRAINLYDHGSPSLGICQIKYTTARSLGYKGTPELLWHNPKVNIYWASKYLSRLLSRYGGDRYKAVSAYNLGHFQPRQDGTAVNYKYVEKVMMALQEER